MLKGKKPSDFRKGDKILFKEGDRFLMAIVVQSFDFGPVNDKFLLAVLPHQLNNPFEIWYDGWNEPALLSRKLKKLT